MIPESLWQEPDPASRCILSEIQVAPEWDPANYNWKKLLSGHPVRAYSASKILEDRIDNSDLEEYDNAPERLPCSRIDDDEEKPSIDEHYLEHLAVLKQILLRVDNPHFAVEPLEVINALADFGSLLLTSECCRDLGVEVIDTYGRPGEVSDAIGNVKMISRHRSVSGIDLKQLGTGILELAENFRLQMSYQTRLIQSQDEHPLEDWDEVAFDEPRASSFLAARERMYKLRQENNRRECTINFLEDLLDKTRKVSEKRKVQLETLRRRFENLEPFAFDSLATQCASQGKFPNTSKINFVRDFDDEAEIQTRNLGAESRNSQRTGLSFD